MSHPSSATARKLVVFAALAVLLVLAALFAEHLCPYDPYAQNLREALQAPSEAHLLGTDRYGRDMLSRVIVGSRTSIFSTLLLVAVITVLGTVVGVFIMSVLKTGLLTVGLRQQWQVLFTGLVLIGAILLDVMKFGKGETKKI